MSDVLLICPNALDINIHPIFDEVDSLLLSFAKKRGLVGLARGAFVPPTELLSLSAYLIKNGITVTILDLTLEALKGNNTTEMIDLYLKKENPSIVGVRAGEICFINQYYNISSKVRNYNKNIRLVCGGVSATGYVEEFLQKKMFDIVVIGEGEITFLELCKNILIEKNINDIRGIAFKDKKKLRKNAGREFINLNDLLLPNRDIYPLKELYKINGGIDLIYASRGCPNNCSFCNAPEFWRRKWRSRNPKDIIDELIFVVSKGAKIVHIYDLNFGVDRKWIKEICRLINRERLDILWDCQLTVDNLNRDTLKDLHEGGCRGAFIGIESANQNILNNTNKYYLNSHLLKGLENAQNQGVHIDGGYVIGLPDDNLKTLNDTKNLAINLLKKDLVETPIFFLFNPWKGSLIGDNPSEYGVKIVNNDLSYWHGFSSRPISSTRYVDANTVYDIWESGMVKIKDVLLTKIKD